MSDVLWTFDRVSLGESPSPRLHDLSLEIRRGMTAVVGYSGAGKTSLLNLLVDYERPDRGRVVSRVGEGSSDADRLAVFWLPQDDGLWPRTSVRRHLELVRPAARRESVDALLDDFDLATIAAATPERLSRGEAARLAVARAIASEAAVLVLDEPLAHVDPARRGRYWERLVRHVESSRTSLVFASHEPGDVLCYAERVVGLKDGRLVFDGAARTLYDAPPSEAAALLLGPVNWLDEGDRERWKLGDGAASACLRPERLVVEPCPSAAVAVVSSRPGGPVTESELQSVDTNEVRRFRHRSLREPLPAGTRVRLTVLALLAALSLGGCLPAAGGPQLDVASERSFSLPSHGALIPQPRDVAIGHDGEKIVLDNAGRVLVYDAAGELVRQWDMPESSVGNPEGACVLADGRIVVADTHYHRVVVFDSDGTVVDMFGELGRGPGQFIYPVAVATDPDGHLYVAEYGGNDRIQKFDRMGTRLTQFGSFGTGKGQFQRPSGIVWLDGMLYVVDAFNSRVHIFTDSGEYRGLLGTPEVGLHYPYDMSLGPDGRLYVVEYAAGRITVLTTDGDVAARYGSTGSDRGQLRTPWGLAVDAAGRIWVADTGNRRIVEIVPTDAEGPPPLGLVRPALHGGEGRNRELRPATHPVVAASHSLRGTEIRLAGFAGGAP